MEEQEYRVPAKLLTRREPIFFNRLSVLEAVQWGILGVLAYFGLNLLPFGFVYKVGVLGAMAMVGFVFIHVPVNGLTGLEWLYILLRYRIEEEQHQAKPPLSLNLPTFSRLDRKMVEEIEPTELTEGQFGEISESSISRFQPVATGTELSGKDEARAETGNSLTPRLETNAIRPLNGTAVVIEIEREG